MNVPRPLLVLVVVIVILGVASCGLGVIRGRMDAAGPQPTPATAFEGLSNEAVPPRDVTVEAVSGSCTKAGITVTVTAVCKLTVDPRSLRPRKLRLAAVGAPIAVVVTQHIRGADQTKDKVFFTDDTIEVSIAGTSPVIVDVSCSCTLTFLT